MLLQLQLLLLLLQLHLQAQLDSDRLDWFSTTSAGQLPSFSLLLGNEEKKKNSGKPAIPLAGYKFLAKRVFRAAAAAAAAATTFFSAREPVRAARCSC